MLRRVIAYGRGLAARRRTHAEVQDELEFHLQQEIDARIARGATPAEARRTALASLGGLTQTIEATRDVRATWLDAVARDVRHAFRSLAATPAFTVVALAVLTLGIGATTAVFSVVDGVMLRGLPFPDADRLAAVGELNVKSGSEGGLNLVAPQNFIDWRAQQSVFTGLAAIGYASVSLRPEAGQEPEILEAQAVTADFFPVLGVEPFLGRTFTPDNEVDGRAFVAVISYDLWQRRFGGARDVIGRYLPGQRADFQIVGVMPPGFAYPVGAARPTAVWLPNVFRPEDRVRADDYSYRLHVIARLREGRTFEQAQAEMDAIMTRLAAETPRWFEDRVALVEPLRDYLTRGVRAWMLMLLAAVGFVLLIACVNLANLMLVRASARSRELEIRSALGASRWDLARGLLVEGLILSLGGAALGIAVAWLGVEVLRAVMPSDLPRIAAIVVDLRVLGAMLTVAVGCGVVFSGAPMLQASRPAVGSSLTRAMRGTPSTPTMQWLRGALVTFEVALAVVLLIGAALFLASFARVANVDLGIDPRNVLTVRVRPLVGAKNWETAQLRNRDLLRNVLDRVSAIPGVDAAALVGGGVPLRGDLRTIEFGIPGRVFPPNEDLDFNEVSPDYFRVMRVPLVAGRFFDQRDRHGSEAVAIINQAAATRYFRGQDPVGQVVQFQGTRRVVGVVGNIRHDGPETDWRRQGFVPLDQSRAVGATLVMRLSRDAGDVLPAVKAAIWSYFPGVALPDIQTLSEYLNRLVAQRRFNMLLLTLFGLLGIVIACVGVYGVMTYAVILRRQEIGIRMALGAGPGAVLWSILGRAAGYVAGGLALGLTGGWALATLIAGFLFQVHPHDPWLYASVAVVLLGTGLAAAFLPARRAARTDPLLVLRMD